MKKKDLMSKCSQPAKAGLVLVTPLSLWEKFE
jgi:hypothetical protein